MRNYLLAEGYKVLRRKYLYITLAVCLLGEALLLGGSWFTYSRGNPYISFASMAGMVLLILSFGVYATMITGDVVFSDQYKWTTLKNEVSFGLSRVTIYVGKLFMAILISVVSCIVLLGAYLGGSWLLFSHSAMDGQVLAQLAYCLAGALPIWLAALSVVMACYFNLKSNTAAAFLSIGILAVLPSVFQVLGILVNDIFTLFYQYMPTVVLDSLKNHVGDWGYVGLAWWIGAAWFVGALAIGLVGFSKKEIR